MRRPCVRYLSAIEDIGDLRCATATTTEENCYARAGIEYLITSLPNTGRSITIEEQSKTALLSKEALRALLLSEWTSFMEGLHLVQENTLTSAYSIFAFEHLYSVPLGTLMLLEDCTFTNLGSDSICRYLRKAIQDYRPFSIIRMSILRDVKSILVAVERDSLFSGPQRDFLYWK